MQQGVRWGQTSSQVEGVDGRGSGGWIKCVFGLCELCWENSVLLLFVLNWKRTRKSVAEKGDWIASNWRWKNTSVTLIWGPGLCTDSRIPLPLVPTELSQAHSRAASGGRRAPTVCDCLYYHCRNNRTESQSHTVGLAVSHDCCWGVQRHQLSRSTLTFVVGVKGELSWISQWQSREHCWGLLRAL